MKLKLLLTFLLLGIAQMNFAQPGEIDNAFNFGGTGAKSYNTSGVVDNNANCNVYASEVYNETSSFSDKIIIAGRFEEFNGVARRYVARLNADGTLDTSFVGPAFLDDQYIYCIKILPNNKILIGGGFKSGSYQSIARLNEDGSLDTSFNAGAGNRGVETGKLVHALEVQNDGKILIGGEFGSYNGTSKQRIARLDANGYLDTTFGLSGAVDGEVRSLAMQDNKIIVGGFFSKHGTNFQGLILRLNSDGSYDPSFNSGYGNNNTKGLKYNGTSAFSGATAVFDLVVLPSDSQNLAGYIYASGKFDTYNGNPVTKSIMRFTKDGFIDSSFNSTYFAANPTASGVVNAETNSGSGYGKNIFAMQLQPDGKVLIGGNFISYNNESLPKGIARLNADGSIDTDFLTGSGFTGGTGVFLGKSVVRNIVLQSDGKTVVGGDFQLYNNQNKRMIVRIKTRECTKFAQFSGSSWIGAPPTDENFYTVIYEYSNLTIPTGTHYNACELEIRKNATITIQEGASFTVKGIIMNNGTFTVNNNGSLVQIKDDAKNADLGAGNFIYKRNTTPVKRFDYTYWSSPVEKQQLYGFSPNTLSDKFYEYNTSLNSWSPIPFGNANMIEGHGYIIRAPQNHSTTVASIFYGQFKGRPNNGVIKVPIIHNSGSSMNLIGNPYPSSISASSFINNPANTSVLEGTIYLWTHNSGPVANGTGSYVYTNADYMVYNLTGGTTTTPTGVPFGGMIAAGQGFFIKGKITGEATFNNNMRSTAQNSQFLRVSSSSSSVQASEKNRLWLDLTDATGTFSQMLVGYIEGATNDYEGNFDGESMNSNAVGLYSLIADKNYTIQGRALPFNNQDIVPVGYKASAAGTYEIKLSAFDGLFTDQNVYLVDKLLNVTHNLKNGSYSFNSVIGTFNTRFEIHFALQTSLATQSFDAGNDVKAFTGNSTIGIASNNESISEVQVYDVVGKLLYSNANVDSKALDITTIRQANQMLLIKIKLNNNAETVKKIIF